MKKTERIELTHVYAHPPRAVWRASTEPRLAGPTRTPADRARREPVARTVHDAGPAHARAPNARRPSS